DAITSAGKTGLVAARSNDPRATTLALFDNSLVGKTDWPPGSGNSVSANCVIAKYVYAGDVNLDGQVNAADYDIANAHLGTTPPLASAWLNGDLDLDGSVDAGDFGILDANVFSSGAAPAITAASVA